MISEVRNLGELVNIKTGRLDANAMEKDGKFPFFTCAREIFRINNYAFDTKAILLAGNNASGDFNVKYYDGKFNAYQRTYVITINDENQFNYSYLKHKLEGHLKVFKNHALGANTRFLKIGMIKDLQIPLPQLDQQKKIAAILDAGDAYRQKTKALIEKYNELTQSLFLDMFGELEGDKVSLSSICEINPKKSQISSLDRSLKVSFVPMTNVSEEGGLSLVEERTIDDVWSGFTYFQEDDVVFAKITPCMENGKGTIMRGLKNKIGFGTTEFHVLRPTNKVSCSEYLFYLTHSTHFRVLAELNMKGSAGQKRVPKDFFDRYKVVAPSIALQNQFAERVQVIETQKAQAQASLVQAEDLFNSLLQRAFKGELTS